MCGRYRLSRAKQIIEEHFDSISGEEDWIPRYNIAPTQPVPIIRQHPKEPRRDWSLVRWGLIPPWAKDIHRMRFTGVRPRVFCLPELNCPFSKAIQWRRVPTPCV
jgi:putative SOS response-associated peptidase YedK